jgi:hypothetical protein
MGEKELKIENSILPSRGHSHPDPIALPVLSAAPYAPPAAHLTQVVIRFLGLVAWLAGRVHPSLRIWIFFILIPSNVVWKCIEIEIYAAIAYIPSCRYFLHH